MIGWGAVNSSLAWRLVCEGRLTVDGMAGVSINDCDLACRALDAWHMADAKMP